MKFQWNKQYTDAVLIALAVIFPIILSGIPIGDDYLRLYHGNDFSTTGRWFSSWLFQILVADKFLFNLFPLPQILGIIIYAVSLSWIVQKISITDRFSSALIILLSLSYPFIFQDYAYQYDCLTMMLALSIFSITPFIFIPQKQYKKEWLKYSLFKILLLISGLLFYQTALVSFIIFSIFIYLLYDNSNKNKILTWHAVLLIIAYLVDYFIILSFGDTGYYKRQSNFMFMLIIENIIYNSNYIISYISPYYKNIFVIISHIVVVVFAFNYLLNNKNKKFINAFYLLVIILINIIIISIPSNLLFTPRLLLSMSSAYLCVSLLAFMDKDKVKILRCMLFLAIIPAIVVLCIFTNTASMQNKYERMLITSIYNGLSNIELDEKQKLYFACDHNWFSPYTKKVVDRYPYMMGFIYTDHLRKWYFIREYMGNYHIKNAQEFSYSKLDDVNIKNMLQTSKESTHKYHHYLYDIYEYQNKNNKKDIVICINPTK